MADLATESGRFFAGVEFMARLKQPMTGSTLPELKKQSAVAPTSATVSAGQRARESVQRALAKTPAHGAPSVAGPAMQAKLPGVKAPSTAPTKPGPENIPKGPTVTKTAAANPAGLVGLSKLAVLGTAGKAAGSAAQHVGAWLGQAGHQLDESAKGFSAGLMAERDFLNKQTGRWEAPPLLEKLKRKASRMSLDIPAKGKQYRMFDKHMQQQGYTGGYQHPWERAQQETPDWRAGFYRGKEVSEQLGVPSVVDDLNRTFRDSESRVTPYSILHGLSQSGLLTPEHIADAAKRTRAYATGASADNAANEARRRALQMAGVGVGAAGGGALLAGSLANRDNSRERAQG